MRYFFPVLFLLLTACGSPSGTEQSTDTKPSESQVQEPPVLEEQFPDSGLLQGVDPEQIMTDDWSDDGDLELETEEKK